MANMEEIKKFICEKLNTETLDTEALITSYGIDSLEVVELVMDLEESFGVRLENDDFKKIKTVGDLLKIIEEKLK